MSAGDRAPERVRPVSTPTAPRTVTTSELLRDRRELVIVHGDEVYRLRLTRANKLILTK